MTCVAQSAAAGMALPDVLLKKGFLNQSQIEGIRNDLDSGASVEEELQFGNTIVVEELETSRREPTMVSTTQESIADHTTLYLDGEARYEFREELGRGGMGLVVRARDRVLRRDVAIKSLLETATTDKFRDRLLMEAQVTGLLEHPNVTPVYDLRMDDEGRPFYTMRVVRERDLGQIIHAMKSGAESFSISFLVQVLRQVSLTIEYAHRQGVVHRDLKPDNILVGAYGEVYVIDWGIAKLMSSNHGLEDTEQIVVGSLIGTPKYMAPEQARGDNDQVNEKTDVYALGAILYEILTLQAMYEADHVLGLLFMIVHDELVPPRERAPGRSIPVALEEICVKALAKNPAHRYESAQAFADELELFLEGVKDRERRQELAIETMQMAEQVRAVYDEVRMQHRTVKAELDRTRRNVPAWSTGEDKDELWSLEQQAEDLAVEIERRFSETVRMFSEALVHWPDMPEARLGLANLYWQRFEEAENSGRIADAAYLEGLVRQFNDGSLDSLLEGTGTLSLEVDPPGASVELYRYHQHKRRLVEWLHATLQTPVKDAILSHGSYVAIVSKPGFRTVRVPIAMGRVDRIHKNVKLFAEAAFPKDFVQVPPGFFKRTNEEVYVDEFAIMRTPVTVKEYLEFLNSIHPSLAERHAPRIEEDGESYLSRDERGRYVIPKVDIQGDVWDPQWPILMVNYHDALAYAKWRGERDGFSYRLPTELEWEKAARGVDGRVYPWGDHFDATFCCMKESRNGRPVPSPVGEFAVDCSPYDVVDMAGNIVEWTQTPESENANDRLTLKGAAYNSPSIICRLDVSLASPPQFRYAHYGFRLALGLE